MSSIGSVKTQLDKFVVQAQRFDVLAKKTRLNDDDMKVLSALKDLLLAINERSKSTVLDDAGQQNLAMVLGHFSSNWNKHLAHFKTMARENPTQLEAIAAIDRVLKATSFNVQKTGISSEIQKSFGSAFQHVKQAQRGRPVPTDLTDWRQESTLDKLRQSFGRLFAKKPDAGPNFNYEGIGSVFKDYAKKQGPEFSQVFYGQDERSLRVWIGSQIKDLQLEGEKRERVIHAIYNGIKQGAAVHKAPAFVLDALDASADPSFSGTVKLRIPFEKGHPIPLKGLTPGWVMDLYKSMRTMAIEFGDNSSVELAVKIEKGKIHSVEGGISGKPAAIVHLGKRVKAEVSDLQMSTNDKGVVKLKIKGYGFTKTVTVDEDIRRYSLKDLFAGLKSSMAKATFEKYQKWTKLVRAAEDGTGEALSAGPNASATVQQILSAIPKGSEIALDLKGASTVRTKGKQEAQVAQGFMRAVDHMQKAITAGIEAVQQPIREVQAALSPADVVFKRLGHLSTNVELDLSALQNQSITHDLGSIALFAADDKKPLKGALRVEVDGKGNIVPTSADKKTGSIINFDPPLQAKVTVHALASGMAAAQLAGRKVGKIIAPEGSYRASALSGAKTAAQWGGWGIASLARGVGWLGGRAIEASGVGQTRIGQAVQTTAEVAKNIASGTLAVGYVAGQLAYDAADLARDEILGDRLEIRNVSLSVGPDGAIVFEPEIGLIGFGGRVEVPQWIKTTISDQISKQFGKNGLQQQLSRNAAEQQPKQPVAQQPVATVVPQKPVVDQKPVEPSLLVQRLQQIAENISGEASIRLGDEKGSHIQLDAQAAGAHGAESIALRATHKIDEKSGVEAVAEATGVTRQGKKISVPSIEASGGGGDEASNLEFEASVQGGYADLGERSAQIAKVKAGIKSHAGVVHHDVALEASDLRARADGKTLDARIGKIGGGIQEQRGLKSSVDVRGIHVEKRGDSGDLFISGVQAEAAGSSVGVGSISGSGLYQSDKVAKTRKMGGSASVGEIHIAQGGERFKLSSAKVTGVEAQNTDGSSGGGAFVELGAISQDEAELFESTRVTANFRKSEIRGEGSKQTSKQEVAMQLRLTR
jgi:hypothetical protein